MKRIMIIDDEFIFRQGLKYMMDWEACGYSIVGEACNGAEGLKIFLKLHPDIILCDVVMPGVDGIEFVKMIRKYNGPPVVILSNFDEFDKVREAFQYGASDYLLKNRVTKEMILECLDRLIPEKKRSICLQSEKTFGILARTILDGYGQDNFDAFQSYVRQSLPKRNYQMILFFSPQPDFQNEEDLQMFLQENRNCPPALSCFTTQNHAIVLFSCSEVVTKRQNDILMEMLVSRTRHTSCVVSIPFSDLVLFKEKAEKLLDLCGYSILYENQLCFYEEELSEKEGELPSFPNEQYVYYAEHGKWKEACDLLLEYMDKLKNSTKMDPFRFKKFVEYTFYSSLKNARQFAKDSIAISRIELKLFKQLDCILTYSQFCEAVTSAYGELSVVCGEKNVADDVSESLQNYLEDHYMEQITLYDVADYLHMNYSYLSAYISNRTGKHFSEHLNDTRIRHSKKLLADTAFSISHISECIGYADQSYFGRVFKKQVGMTPLQYRNKMQRKDL